MRHQSKLLHVLAGLPVAMGLAALLLLGVPEAGRADEEVVRLESGGAIKGETGQSTETMLVMEDFVTGALRKLVWEVIHPEDRRRLREKLGFESGTARLMAGHRVRQRLADGTVDDVLGLVISTGPAGTRIKRQGREMTIPADQVVEILEEEMDPRDIHTSRELYDAALARMVADGADPNALTSAEHFLIGEEAMWCESLEEAQQHFAAAAADEAYPRAPLARSRLEQIEGLLRDRAAYDALRNIRMAISLRSFGRARTSLAEFEATFAEAGPAVKQRFEDTRTLFDNTRNDYFRKGARLSFVRLLNQLIRPKVREKDIEVSDVMGWMKRGLPEAAFELLAVQFRRNDPDMTVEQAMKFWDERPKAGWPHSATFAGGTFIVFKPKIEPPKPSPGGGNSGKQKSGPQKKFTPPKPPTRDSWWKGADPGERQDWVLAKFALESGLFEVNERHIPTVCAICTGAGLQSVQNSNGTLTQFLCTRCGGARNDIRVRFR